AWLLARGRDVALAGLAQPPAGDPFAVLAGLLGAFRSEPLPGLPPFQGGAAGLFGYDLCHHLERPPPPPHREFRLPAMAVGRYHWVIAFDPARRRTWLLSTGFPERDPEKRKEHAARRLRGVRRLLRRPATRSLTLPARQARLPAAALCPQF